jgi:hypothetical protein
MSEKTKSPLAIPLANRAVIAVSGMDAPHFLHNVLTANIEALQPGKGTLAALLTPQGKIISDMLVFNASDAEGAPEEATFLIDCPLGLAGDLVERLGKYKLRADAEITPLPAEIGVVAVFDAPPLSGETFYAFDDPRHAALGQRLIGPADEIARATASLARVEISAYHLRRTTLGVPELGRDFMASDAFPHEALLDQLGAIDFRKGCYVGQEVVSRMEHRGTARTRALPVRFRNGFGVVGGAEIRAGETLIGRLGEPAGDRAIGMIRLDRLDEALKAGIPVLGGGVELDVIRPDFVRFAVPGVN